MADKVRQLDQDFHLVMIAEELEESLVLLGQSLCWPLANLTSLRLNARAPALVSNLTSESRARLKQWLWADYALYDHFKERLEERKQELGVDKLREGVKGLRKMNEVVEQECVVRKVRGARWLPEEFRPWSKDVMGFKVREERGDCRYFAMAEVHFIDTVRQEQIQRFSRWREEQG